MVRKKKAIDVYNKPSVCIEAEIHFPGQNGEKLAWFCTKYNKYLSSGSMCRHRYPNFPDTEEDRCPEW